MIRDALSDLYCLAVICVTESIGRLPWCPIQRRLLDVLGWTAYHLSSNKRRAIESALETAFGASISQAEKRRITLESLRDFWFEMVHWVPAFGRRLALDQVPVRGIEHLHAALRAGGGAILWESKGFGRRILIKRVLHALGLPVEQMHGERHLAVLHVGPGPRTRLLTEFIRPLFKKREETWVSEILIIPGEISIAQTRSWVSKLSANGILCVSGEGRAARSLVPITFLGETVGFAPGMVKLSLMTGAPLLPILWHPEGGPLGCIQILPPIPVSHSLEKEAAVEKALCRFASELEERIRRWPGAYRNWHLLRARS